MKLLIISHHPSHHPLDAPRVFRSVGEELQKCRHTVHYFIENRNAKSRRKPATPIERAIRITPSIIQACQMEQYDVILTPTVIGWCLSTFRKWLPLENTKIVSWHCGHELLERNPNRPEQKQMYSAGLPVPGKLFETLQQSVYQKSLNIQDACLVTSTQEREELQIRYPQAAHKILYLPVGVSPHYYYPERFTNDVSETPNKLLFVGPWEPWANGTQYLADAFRRLLLKYPELRLSLVNTRLEANVVLRDFPVETQMAVSVMPHVEEQALPELYRNHDIFLRPSLFDGLPLTLMEALASAMPVITTEIYGMKDIIFHYDNGLLIPPGDANALEQSIGHLIENPSLCRQLGESAYETASRYYTWRQVSDILEKHLSLLLEDSLPQVKQQAQII